MERRTIAGALILVLLAACAQVEFLIDDDVFSQESMAHAATLGTIYMTENKLDGTHDCDDDPSTCCAAGYRLCTVNEFRYGGRELETTGTDRVTNAYNTAADADPIAEDGNYDCLGWTATSGRIAYSRTVCSYTTTASCVHPVGTCGSTVSQWCCSR